MNPDFVDLLRAFIEAEVRFLIVGAYALAHTSAPVELQVELLHKGGLSGGAPAQNGDAVTKNVLEYVDQFATRVKSANR